MAPGLPERGRVADRELGQYRNDEEEGMDEA